MEELEAHQWRLWSFLFCFGPKGQERKWRSWAFGLWLKRVRKGGLGWVKSGQRFVPRRGSGVPWLGDRSKATTSWFQGSEKQRRGETSVQA